MDQDKGKTIEYRTPERKRGLSATAWIWIIFAIFIAVLLTELLRDIFFNPSGIK